MLEVQKYLKSGKTLDDLKAEFDISANHHPNLPIFNLNYGIYSPKTNPIVMECRSLCLDDKFDLVARSFPRFFNLHETPEINDRFNWSNFSVLEKVDGWFCKVFWYKDQWVFSSRSGFGDNQVNDPNLTFGQLCRTIMTLECLNMLDKKICYTFEVVGPYTKIVRHYTSNRMYLLTAFRNNEEMPFEYISKASIVLNYHSNGNVTGLDHYIVGTAEETMSLISRRTKEDKTWEGVVLRDSNNMRIKIKSPSYIALHHLRGEGNLFLPKYIIPLILAGDYDEILEYWPEVKDAFAKVKDRIDLHQQRVIDLWDKVKDIDSQKDFALSIQQETPFTPILFKARKEGRHPKEIWKESAEYIHKVLYA